LSLCKYTVSLSVVFSTIFIKIFGGDTKSMTVLSVDYQYIKMNNNIKKRHLFRELSHYPLVISF